METLLIVLVSMAAGQAGTLLYQRFKARRGSSSLTDYSTAIDQITDSGLERYRLHKAMKDPTVREQMKGTALYERAAAQLGWD